jgi:hypothetical protein
MSIASPLRTPAADGARCVRADCRDVAHRRADHRALTPQTQAKLDKLAQETGRNADELVEDALIGCAGARVSRVIHWQS